jgi:hypothetical protein
LAGLSACGVDGVFNRQPSEMNGDHNLPSEQRLSSSHFRYHTRAGDAAICDDLLDTLEQHFVLLESTLGFDWPSGHVIDYYKFIDAADFKDNAPCPSGSAGCSFGGNIYTSELFEQHELVHAYLWPVADPPVVVSEGVAVALSCSHPLPSVPTLTLDEALHASDALSDPRVYETGGRFARFLIDRYGAPAFLSLYVGVAQAGRTPSRDAFDGALRAVYGLGADQLWVDMLVTQASCAQPFACSRAALPVDGTPVPVKPTCGLSSDSRTFAISTDGNVAISGPPKAKLGSCSLPPASRSTDAVASDASQVGLLQVVAGRYFLTFDPREPSSVAVQAARVPWSGSSCDSLQAYTIAADEGNALTVTIPDKEPVWYLRLHFEGAKQLSLSHRSATADESVKATVCQDCDFYSSRCVVADLADDTLAVSGNGDYFIRFETLAAVSPNRVEIVGR